MFDVEKFVTQRLTSFKTIPIAWGSPEAIEAMARQLIEIEMEMLYPQIIKGTDSIYAFMEAFNEHKFLSTVPLHTNFKAGQEREFAEKLFTVYNRAREILKSKAEILSRKL